MIPRSPHVTIGIPVYNGENYLEETIISILDQTFTDFELIISDNRSTDRTETICRTYQVCDNRICYIRNARNLGAAKNYNQLVYRARGKYFKWAPHDDVCAPELLEHCVTVLDADDSIILCYSLTQDIDEQGNFLQYVPAKPYLTWAQPHRRFFEGVCNHHDQTPILGLMRTDILRQTMLIGGFPQSDKVLLGELMLHGRSYEVPEYLLFRRRHAEQGWRQHNTQQERMHWFDPTNSDRRVYASWRLFHEHLKSIGRAPLSKSERTICYLSMGWWVRRRWRLLLNDLITDKMYSKRKVFRGHNQPGLPIL